MAVYIISMMFVMPLLLSKAAGCADGWWEYDGICISVEFAMNPGGFRTVLDAQAHCASLGADLGSVETTEKNDEVYKMLRAMPRNIRPNRIFIGLHDINEEDNFEWTSGKDVNFTNWGLTEPNNNFRGDEDCVVIESDDNRWLSNGRTTWRDYPCCIMTRIYAVLCQRRPTDHAPYSLLFTPFARKCDIVLACPPVPTWRDIWVDTSERLVDTVVNYTCVGDGAVFQLHPEKTNAVSRCNDTGKWDPPFDTCALTPKAHKRAIERVPVEAPGAAVIGTTGLIVMLIELGVVVLVDLDHLRSHAFMCAGNIFFMVKMLSPSLGGPPVSVYTHAPAQEFEMV